MLRQDAPQLQRALDDAGLKTGDSGLQFSLRDQSSPGQNNGNEASRNAQRLIDQRRRHQPARRSPAAATAACSDRAAASTSGSEENGHDRQQQTVARPVVSGTTRRRPSSSSSGSLSSTTGATLAGNFQTFLTLLTTQLQNQNPLDPLDTNQFTQQLVQFAGVEQQLKTNDQLTTLVSLQQTAQSTQALGFVGKTAVVDGSTTAPDQQFGHLDFERSDQAPTSRSRSPTAPGKPSSPATIPSMPATTRPSPGTARATTARSGRTASTRSRRPPPTARAIPSRSPPRSRAWSTRSISPRSPPLLSINGQTYTVSQIKSIVS